MRTSLIFTFIFLLLSKISYSQDERNYFELKLGGGITIPSGNNDFSKYWDAGYDLGLEFGGTLNPYLSLSISFDYSHYQFNSQEFLGDTGFDNLSITTHGASTSTYTATGNLVVNIVPSGKICPYVMLGLGILLDTKENITLTLNNSSTTIKGESLIMFLIAPGIGINYLFNNTFQLFLEGSYGYGISGEEENRIYIPIKLGMCIRI
jgi:hypothetical protein